MPRGAAFTDSRLASQEKGTKKKKKKGSAKQRARRGWADVDCWDLDLYLAGVLHGAIRHLADNVVTSPPQLSLPEWRDLLCDMAEGFAVWRDAEGAGLFDDFPVRRVQHSLKLLRKWWPHLWD